MDSHQHGGFHKLEMNSLDWDDSELISAFQRAKLELHGSIATATDAADDTQGEHEEDEEQDEDEEEGEEESEEYIEEEEYIGEYEDDEDSAYYEYSKEDDEEVVEASPSQRDKGSERKLPKNRQTGKSSQKSRQQYRNDGKNPSNGFEEWFSAATVARDKEPNVVYPNGYYNNQSYTFPYPPIQYPPQPPMSPHYPYSYFGHPWPPAPFSPIPQPPMSPPPPAAAVPPHPPSYYHQAAAEPPQMPQPLPDDPAVKEMLKAWYLAGFYTGRAAASGQL